MLAAYGMRAGRDYEPDPAPLSTALVALGGGTLDAVVQVIGIPADQIRTGAASVGLRLLPVDETVLVSGRISGHEGKKGFLRRLTGGGSLLGESRFAVGRFGDVSDVASTSATWAAGTIYTGNGNWGTGVLWRFDR